MQSRKGEGEGGAGGGVKKCEGKERIRCPTGGGLRALRAALRWTRGPRRPRRKRQGRVQAAPRTMSTLFTRSERCTSFLLRARLEGMAGGAGGAGPSGQERVAGPCESARLYALEFFYLQTGAMAAY